MCVRTLFVRFLSMLLLFTIFLIRHFKNVNKHYHLHASCVEYFSHIDRRQLQTQNSFNPAGLTVYMYYIAVMSFCTGTLRSASTMDISRTPVTCGVSASRCGRCSHSGIPLTARWRALRSVCCFANKFLPTWNSRKQTLSLGDWTVFVEFYSSWYLNG